MPTHDWLVIGFAIMLAAIFIERLVPRRPRLDGASPWPYYARKPLSAPEQVLYHRLVKALPKHIGLAQVQVSRVIGVKRGHNFAQWNNRINRLSYDFVVYGPDASVIAVIELDDRSHHRSDRRATDAKKNRATRATGIPMIRWHVQAIPGTPEIQIAVLSNEIAKKQGNDEIAGIPIHAER